MLVCVGLCCCCELYVAVCGFLVWFGLLSIVVRCVVCVVIVSRRVCVLLCVVALAVACCVLCAVCWCLMVVDLLCCVSCIMWLGVCCLLFVVGCVFVVVCLCVKPFASLVTWRVALVVVR